MTSVVEGRAAQAAEEASEDTVNRTSQREEDGHAA